MLQILTGCEGVNSRTLTSCAWKAPWSLLAAYTASLLSTAKYTFAEGGRLSFALMDVRCSVASVPDGIPRLVIGIMAARTARLLSTWPRCRWNAESGSIAIPAAPDSSIFGDSFILPSRKIFALYCTVGYIILTNSCLEADSAESPVNFRMLFHALLKL